MSGDDDGSAFFEDNEEDSASCVLPPESKAARSELVDARRLSFLSRVPEL